ncbi:MAG: T9SS type A sorting domain-containing protein [Bacteroidota bacterium]
MNTVTRKLYYLIFSLFLSLFAFSAASAQTTYYSYISGNWSDSDTWTTDPSGTLPAGVGTPGAGDVAVILSGRTVTLTADVATSDITIESGATVDLGAFVFATVTGSLRGQGKLKSSLVVSGSAYVPAYGPATNSFFDADGGTMEFAFTSALAVKLPNKQTRYNNLIINLSSVADTAYFASDCALDTNQTLTIHGDLHVLKGAFQIGSHIAPTCDNRLVIDIKQDVTVAANGKITVGKANTNTNYLTAAEFAGVRVNNIGAPTLRNANDQYYYYATVSSDLDGPFSISNVGKPAAGPFPTTANSYHKIFHRVYVGGDFINDGIVKFHNLSSIVFDELSGANGSTTLTSGAATVYFQGATDNTLSCNNFTDFYNLVIDKGTSNAHQLTIYSDAYTHFRLWGPNTLGGDGKLRANPVQRKALWIKNGTLRLTGTLALPSLSEGSQDAFPYKINMNATSDISGSGDPGINSDFAIPASGKLLIDGSDVIVLSTADFAEEVNFLWGLVDGVPLSASTTNNYWAMAGSAFSVYGTFEINDGYASGRGSGGFVFWNISGGAGNFLIKGGDVDASQLRSAVDGGGKSTFDMSGGKLRLRGRFSVFGVNTTPDQTMSLAKIKSIGNSVGTHFSAMRDSRLHIADGLGTLDIDQDATVFNMSGGEITILDVVAPSPAKVIEINSTAGNYAVTGGTIKVLMTHALNPPSDSLTCDDRKYFITNAAPLANLVIDKQGAFVKPISAILLPIIPCCGRQNGITPRPVLPLTVLNDLTIKNGAIFNASGQDVIIGGNLTVEAGGTYYTGTRNLTGIQTTIMNGAAAQTINVAANTVWVEAGKPGFNSLKMDKATGTLTVGSNLDIRHTLTLTQGSLPSAKGIFDDGGKLIKVSGSIYNDATHTGAGSIQIEGGIADVTVNNGGTYAMPTITGTGGTGAMFKLQIINGVITSIALVDAPNSGYTTSVGSREYLSFNGVKTNASAYYTKDNATGKMVSVTLDYGGSGYGPTGVVSGGGGSGAVVYPVLVGTTGAFAGTGIITAVDVVASGSGYTSIPTITTAPASASLTAVMSNIISGDGNGQFGNLTINKPNSSATLTAAQTVKGTLTLTNGVLDLGIYQLSLTSNQPIGGAPFSPTHMIRTAGNQSDGGIKKTYSDAPNNTFTFPLGTGAIGSYVYTPAIILVNASSYGTIRVRPDNSRHPFTTSTNALPYYWKVTADAGFAGISSVSHTYNYVGVSPIPGFENTYIPGVYNPTSWTNINDVNLVTEATKTISFSGSGITGDYTAGQLDALGTVTTYYSRQNGNWTDANTWSNTAVGGALGAGIPSDKSPVIIGDGVINHTVTLVADGAISGGLQLNTGSVLDLGITKGHNFGFSQELPIGGSGILRISSSVSPAIFPNGDFGTFISASGGTVEYYTSGISFTIPEVAPPLANAKSTSLISYRNLVINPASAQNITLPAFTAPPTGLTVYGDLTIGLPSYTGLTKISSEANGDLTVNGNLDVQNGTLQFQNNAISARVRNVVVQGDVMVRPGATFDVSTAATATTHLLTLHNTLLNSGTFDMKTGTNNVCNVTFKGINTNSIAGAGGTTDFNILTVDKGTFQTPLLSVTATNFSISGSLPTMVSGSVVGTSPLNLLNGTFRLKTNQIIDLSATTPFTIPESACLSIDAPTGKLNIGKNSTTQTGDLLLAGKLEILNGQVNVGYVDPGGTVNIGYGSYFTNDIRYATVGHPEINIKGGNLTIASSIRKSFNSDNINDGSLVYRQTGGTVILGNGIPASTRPKLEIDNEGSVFEMTGGTIKIIRGGALTSTDAGFGDLYLNPETANVTGGTIALGTSGYGNYVFNIDVRTPLFNLDIFGQIAGGFGTTTVNLNNSPLVLKGNLTLKDNQAGIYNTATLNANDFDVTVAGNFTNQGIYNAGLNTTHFNGSGPTPQLAKLNAFTTFNNLSVETTGVATDFSQSVATVRGNLLIGSGNTMNVTAATMNVNGDIVNSGVQTGSLTLQQGINLNLISKGSYNLPTIIPVGGNGVATFNMIIVDGVITSVRPVKAGSGYSGGNANDVTLPGGAVLRFTVNGTGAIQSVQVIAGGAGYGPKADLSGGSGTGAIIQTIMTPTKETGATAGKAEISAINLVSAGNNYTGTLGVAFTGGSVITLPTATATLSNLANNIDGNGNGQFGTLVLKNALGVTTSANTTINTNITFGVDSKLDIYDNRLVLANAATITGANTNRFIRTNGSLSDLGVRKKFTAGGQSFTFPVGASDNYTPVSYTLTSVSNGAYINLKPVNAKHPNATGPKLDFIRYYWNVTISGTVIPSSHTYSYTSEVAEGKLLKYSGARFNGTPSTWTLGAPSAIDTITRVITFFNNTNLTGDYTAGHGILDSVFVNSITYNSIASGAYESGHTVWNPTPPNPLVGPPSGSSVKINPTHVITVNSNTKLTSSLTINGTLNLNNTIRHNFGTVDGTGFLQIRATNVGDFVFPGGTFADFVSTTGGTVEYYGDIHGDILTRRDFNHLLLTGTSQKRLTEDITVSGNLTISAGILNNTANSKQVDITGNWVSTGGTFTGGQGSVKVKGNFTNGGAFDAENSTLSLKKGFINTGTFTARTSTVSLDSANQSLTGATTFYNLQVNGGNDKTINNPMTVNGLLSLNSGFLNTTATNLLTLGSNASVVGGVGGVNGSYVQGSMAKIGNSDFTFPIGTWVSGGARRYSPIGISSLSGAVTSSTVFTAQYILASSPNKNNLTTPLVNVSNLEYWQLTSSTAATAHVTLAWNTSSQVGNSNTLKVANLTSPENSNSNWENKGGRDATGDIGTTGTITSTYLTTFGLSPVALTFAGVSTEFNNPLPIRLLDFTGKLAKGVVILDWKTASEENSSHFEIERSNDGESFISIGRIQASGSTRQKEQYGFTDQQPLPGTSYYRLKMVDANGSYDYSKRVSIQNAENAVNNESVVLYPNPVAGNEPLKLQVFNAESKPYLVAIYDLQGQELSSATYAVGEGVSDLTISAGLNLPQGMYIVWVRSQSNTKQFKLVMH